MNYVILGNGLLGTELQKQTNWDMLSRKKDRIEATDINTWYKILLSYDVIINCIAFTETYSNDKRKHWDINYKFVSDLVEYCNEYNKKLVHISTDYVYTNSTSFASEEDIPIHGDNWYSYTKLLADAFIELKSNNYLICRGTHKPNPFPYDKAWGDQEGNFDYVNIIASIIIKLINKNCKGIFNTGTEHKTMFLLAEKTKKDVLCVSKPYHVPRDTTMNLSKLTLIK
jgi:dTDP-4-dehydrorhamnose reductase